MRYTLAKHLDINRIDFADSIWQKAILPSISHAAAVWFSDTKQSKNKLSSIQYKFAKAALKIKCMPSATATIGELGWLPINDMLNIKRISYYKHLLSMNNERLPKRIYNALCELNSKDKPCAFNYVRYTKDILNQYGADHMFQDDEMLNISTFKKLVTDQYMHVLKNVTMDKSSLIYYGKSEDDTSMAKYLKTQNCSYKAIQLKFKLRTGVAGIGEDLHRQHRGTGTCHCGGYESVKHLIFYCGTYSNARVQLYMNIRQSYGDDLFNNFMANPSSYLYRLLGNTNDDFNVHFLNYIHDVWKIRKEVIALMVPPN